MLFYTSKSLRPSKNVKNLIDKDDVYFWLRLYDLVLQSILKTSSNSVYACKLPIIKVTLLGVTNKKPKEVKYCTCYCWSVPCLYVYICLLVFENRNLLKQDYMQLYAGFRDLQLLGKVQKDITDKWNVISQGLLRCVGYFSLTGTYKSVYLMYPHCV